MRAANILKALINWIRTLYKGLKIQVIVNKDLTGSIPVLQGLCQGDSMSPIFFNFAANIMLMAAYRILTGLLHLN